MLAWRNTQTLSGQAGMSKKATGVKRLGRFANTGGDCGSAKHGAIDFHVWWCLGQQTRGFRKELKKMWKSVKLPSLTVNKRQNSRKASIYGLCGCLFVCIDMCYIFAFVLVIFFVFEIIPRMAAFDMNSKSVLNPNELWRASVSFVRL